jgi:putative nucleotidyltransferase with HDIG domain
VKELSEVVTIPTLPTIVGRLRETLGDPGVGIGEVAEIVAQDPPIAAKVVRLANCVIYAPRQAIKTVHHAAAVLGISVLDNLVLQASLIEIFAHLEKSARSDMVAMWRHSILVGHVAQAMAKRSPKAGVALPEQLYTCGLLHDIGRFVLLGSDDLDYMELLQSARSRHQASYLLEKERFGFTHAEVGMALAEAWRFPEGTCVPIGSHHDPRVRARSLTALIIVAADQVAHVTERPGTALDPGLWRQLGFSTQMASDVLDFARSCLASIEV